MSSNGYCRIKEIEGSTVLELDETEPVGGKQDCVQERWQNLLGRRSGFPLCHTPDGLANAFFLGRVA